MRFASICSGIGGAEVAWAPLGWEAAWCTEIDPFASAVLGVHFPQTPNLGDFTQIGTDHGPVDVLIGGTPCQSFSVAGKRAGLDDPRGNLTLEYLRLVGRLLPRWVAWENVPGVLSIDGGRTFGTILGLLGQLGYGFAYRILDAQYFGLAQRRRRVFVVSCLRNWRGAAAVLFEPESLRGHPAPSQEARAGITGALGGSSQGSGWRLGGDEAAAGQLVTDTLLSNGGQGSRQDKLPMVTVTLPADHNIGARRDQESLLVAHTLNGSDVQIGDGATVGTLGANQARQTSGDVLALHENQRHELSLSCMAGSLKTGGGKPGQGYPATHDGLHVRRLTPRECERLQGYPDDWTLIEYRGKPAADGPRYRALGNAFAVPVVHWIGARIALVDQVLAEAA